MSNPEDILNGLKSLKLANTANAPAKPSEPTKAWASWDDNLDGSWVDDDFDINQIIGKNKDAKQPYEEEWEDTDGEGDTKSQPHTRSNVHGRHQQTRRQGGTTKKAPSSATTNTNLKTTGIKLGGHTIGIPLKNRETIDDENVWKKKNTADLDTHHQRTGRQADDKHSRRDDFGTRNHNSQYQKDLEHPFPRGVPREPRSMKEKREVKHDSKALKNHNRINPSSRVTPQKDQDRIARDIARLTPVPGWKPPVGNEEDDPYRFDSLKEEVYLQNHEPDGTGKKNGKSRIARDSERLQIVAGWQPDGNLEGDYAHEENGDAQDSSRPKSGHKGERRKKGRKNVVSAEPELKSEIDHIHYSETPTRTPAKKISVKLESRWAVDDDDEKDHSTPSTKLHESDLAPARETVAESRERHRQQKIAKQLDWDNGIQHRGDSDEEAESYVEDSSSYSHSNVYDGVSSVPVSEYRPLAFEDTAPASPAISSPVSQSKPDAKPKTKLKPKASTSLDSMWA
jgi:hypothetical protein